ncbi:MAG: hypothetical protein H7X97_01485 [Opitutaceae bacterium]|nr:hypothetical protein [Verrucomicrobiales bacterium]
MNSALRPSRWLGLLNLVLIAHVTAALHSAAADNVPLPGAKRVLFLGDSITHSGQYVDLIDACFALRFPDRQIEILNIGLPSETVSGLSEEGHAGGKFPRPDLHERLQRVLDKTKPDVVIACYGMNDGIYLPFDVERFAAFTNGIFRLRERVAAANAKIIHVTPPVFDEAKGKGPGYGNTLDRYADWLLGQRAVGWDVVDLHGPMNRALVQGRLTDPKFFLAGDGVHPGELGHWIMAKAILMHLGLKDLVTVENGTDFVATYPNGAQILKLVQQKQRVLRDAWLTDTGHLRPGMNTGVPLAEAQTKAAELSRQIRQLAATTATGLLPAPWQHQDVGAVEVKGHASFDQDTFTLKGTLDTWGTNDGFHFVWQKFNGDGQIVARVLSVENTFNHAKAGVMIRESLATDAKHAEACVTPVDGTQFLTRDQTGGATKSAKTGLDKGKLPYWVKLVRSGSIFSGYESSDGERWTLIGSTNIAMKSETLVGLVTSSHHKTVLCTATLDRVVVTPGLATKP